MVNNPFYPGYSPKKQDEEDINPLYPGYYTGKPIQKKPKSENYIKPIEYNVDVLIEDLDAVGNTVLGAPLAVPRWIKNRIVDDWKQQMKVSIGVGDLSVTDLDDYSTEEFPGANLTLSLNPKDWGVGSEDFEQTKKQASKTALDWMKQTTGLDLKDLKKSNFSDIENQANGKLWTHVLGYGTDAMSWTEREGTEAITARTTAPFKGYSGRAPLDIKGVNGIKWVDEDGKINTRNDLYSGTANAAREFVENRDNAKNRDKNYASFISSAVDSINKEIQNSYINQPQSPHLGRYEGAAKFFDLEAKTISDINGLSKALNKQATSIEKTRRGYDGDAAGSVNKIRGMYTEAVRKSNDRAAAAEALFNSGQITKKTYDNYKKNLNQYNSFLNSLEKQIDGQANKKMPSRDFTKFLRGDTNGKQLTKGDVFKKTIISGFQKDAEFSVLSKNSDRIGALLTDRDLNSVGIDLRARNLIPTISRLAYDQKTNQVREVLDAWDNEKLLERYVWKRVTQAAPERVRRWMDGTVLGEAYKRVNYFGLTPAVDAEGELFFPNKWAEKRYQYKVSLNLDPNTFGLRRIVLDGGSHFKLLEDINLSAKSEYFGLDKDLNPLTNLDATLLERLFDHKHIEGKDSLLKNNDRFVSRLFNGQTFNNLNDAQKEKLYGLLEGVTDLKSWGFKSHWAMKRFGKKLADLSESELDELNSLLRSAGKFNSWANNKFKNGLTAQQRLELFKQIRNKNDSLTPGYKLNRKYIGRLDKIHKRMVALQQWWRGTRLGKTINFFSNWKNIVAERIVAALSKLISRILGAAAASTGILAVVLPFLEKAIAKTLNYGVAIFKAMLKWDTEELSKMFIKDFQKVMKSCLIVMVVVLFPLFVVTLTLFGVIGAAFSPVDATMGIDESVLKKPIVGPMYPPGENEIIKLQKDIYVELNDGSGEVLVNPTSITSQQAQTATFYYIITITPKITIMSPPVRFWDTAEYIQYGPGSKTFWKIPDRELLPFNAGVIISYDSRVETGGSFNFTDKDDSIVLNTAYAATPAVPIYGITDPDTVAVTRYLRVGEYVSDCILTSGVGVRLLTSSYNEATGHGSIPYWNNLAPHYNCTGNENDGTCYAFAIPWAWGAGSCPNSPGCKRCEDCGGSALCQATCIYYGRAIDLSVNDNSSNGIVTFPPMGDPNRVWTVANLYPNNSGGELVGLIATSGNWKLYLTHLDLFIGVGIYKAGDIIGQLHQDDSGPTPHVHIELIDMSQSVRIPGDGEVQGVPVDPALYFGAGSCY